MNVDYLELKPQLVKDQIVRQGLKRWWVAERIGIHPTTLRRWLNGRIHRVKPENVHALAEVLECPVREIVELSKQTPKSSRCAMSCQLKFPSLP